MTGGAQADEEPGFSISDACIAGVRFIGAHPSPPHPSTPPTHTATTGTTTTATTGATTSAINTRGLLLVGRAVCWWLGQGLG